MTEYLYLVRCNDQFYKIGKASDLKDRLSQLQTGNPYALNLVMAYGFPNAMIIERCLHQKFVSKRTNGEWFNLSDNDLNDFAQLCEMLGGSLVERQTVKEKLNRGRPKSNEWRMEFIKDGDRVRAFMRMGSGAERRYMKVGTIEEVYNLDGAWKARCLEYCHNTGYQLKLEGV